jgi:hypothetical protein
MHNSVLTIGARDVDKKIIGGLVAQLQSLLEAAETEAQTRGCLHAAVDTFEFQARGSYEKHGYSVYAVQEDYPAGHRKFLLRKTFPKPA